MPVYSSLDKTIIEKIQSFSLLDESYWSFKGRSTRKHCHALVQYPAMMVPEMQGELIDVVSSIDPCIKTIFDPFVGSGTTLGEAMLRGKDFIGYDINPLAILACEVKSGPLYISKLKEKITTLQNNIENDIFYSISVDFPGIKKWFTHEKQRELSKIYRSIMLEESKWARKIFWLTLSNTIRTVCNSRNSTYKLHIKTEDQIEQTPSAIEIFNKNLLKNLESIKLQKKILSDNNVLIKSKSLSKVIIKNVDSKKHKESKRKYDLIISSPPYGDNQTTVTYGQFSYLSLKWINLNDIDNISKIDLLSNQSSIDSNSLGGILKEHKQKGIEVLNHSKSLRLCIEEINELNPSNVRKIVSFVYDLHLSLKNSIGCLRENGYMFWTLGNRRVSNVEVPLDKIMRELLEYEGCTFIHQIERSILNKRMAKRNQIATTMGKESVLIMRR
ncbi:site-specific DNA-methyltransferase [Yersinia canariae]|uniref:Site-specific DNA-methyltransferase n=1 Tax=Yersinia canariae TaxID=2607663 RepID=A0A857EVA2_9GAMM|nr:DNA methyltransferase [Yersinia canariae]QHB31270.1 site-specific DNA-methyltransferase [Yersinia canariae]